MKTKDFIKMLQEADPSGESHVRLSGGVPYRAEYKEGYWDGPYSYIDEEGNWIYSSQGMKVDIYCKEIDDYVHDLYDRGLKNWEDVENKFKFSLTYSNKSSRDERSQSVLKEAKEAFDNIKEITERFYNNALNEMISNSEKGWKWFQDKKVDNSENPNYHVYFTWKIYDEKGKEQGSNVHNTESIQKSGLWEKLDNGEKRGYYEWVKK